MEETSSTIRPLPNIQKLLNVKNKTQVWLSVELGVSKETINQYIKGIIKPRQDMLIAMSTILNTSVDYILGLTDDPTPSNLTLTEDENALLFNYRQLHDIEKVKVQFLYSRFCRYEELERLFGRSFAFYD